MQFTPPPYFEIWNIGTIPYNGHALFQKSIIFIIYFLMLRLLDLKFQCPLKLQDPIPAPTYRARKSRVYIA